MPFYSRLRRFCVIGALGLVCLGYDQSGVFADDKAPAAKEPEKAAVVPKAEPGYIVGRVTMGDGRPLSGDIKDISVDIQGVSNGGGRVSYAPAVQADGTYRQKVAPGQYRFGRSRVQIVYNKIEIPITLEPVGRLWSKDQDSADGIVQEFVWKLTGPTPFGQSEGLSTTQAMHWYGMCVGLRPSGWRDDLRKAPTAIPTGTKLTFTLKPLGKAIDGSELKPFTVERVFNPALRIDPDLNDLPPAPYELSGVATLPDGKSVPVLIQTAAEYPGYKAVVGIAVEMNNMLGSLNKPLCTFVID